MVDVEGVLVDSLCLVSVVVVVSLLCCYGYVS